MGRAVTAVYWNRYKKSVTAPVEGVVLAKVQNELRKIGSQANEYAASVPFLVPKATVKTKINM